ncbi:LysR family transcriptional regulator [Nocardioides sp. KR10-350]|uniref:LysR family transcriptional regulator n=1 Tax=Nocardioides cheoyonin TaxID=3156615 RepID=UPI0032B4FA05
MADLRKIDLNLLVALEAVLDEQNLTRAAKRVGITQPAMSGALGRLRKLTGDELLVRVGRGFELTPVGEELLPLVRQALEQVERTLAASRNFDPATSSRRFTVSLSDYALYVLGPRLERRLVELAPGVEVAFDSLPAPQDLATHLLRRDLVIGGVGRGIPGRRQEVFRDRFVCVVSDVDTPLVGESATFAELAAMPYLSAWFGAGVSTPVDDALAEHGVRLEPAQQAPGLLTLPFLLPGTQMFAFVPERLALAMGPSLGLRTVTTPLRIPTLVEAAHWHPVNTEEAGLRWLLGVLGEIAEEIDDLAMPPASFE